MENGHVQIYEEGLFYVIKYKLSQKIMDIQNIDLKNYTFDDFQKRGKYPQVKYSYSHKDRIFWMYTNKKYLSQVLNVKKYEVLTYAKNIGSIIQQILEYMKVFSRSDSFKTVHLDIISMTIYKQYEVINSRNQIQIRKLYLRFSNIQFKRSPPTRSKQCDQYFAYMILTQQQSLMIDQTENKLPTDEQYYRSPRVPFIDDLYSNQYFNKRIGRFMLFHQAYGLYYGIIPIQHKFTRQFYQKCSSKWMVNSIRLKKLLYDFKLSRVQKDKDKFQERLRTVTLTLVLNCPDDDSLKNQNKGHLFQFTLEIFTDSDLSQKLKNANAGIQESFLKHLSKSVAEYGSESYLNYYTSTNNLKVLSFKNQLGFCQLLSQLSFFIDRVAYKSISKQTPSQYHCSGILDEPNMNFRTPSSEQFKSQKYLYSYCLQIRSTYNYLALPSSIQEDRNKQKIVYQNVLTKVLMLRKKLTKDITSKENENLQFLSSLQPLRGLTVYINQLLRKWNARDCYHDMNSFTAGYLNVIVDKNKQKSEKSEKSNFKSSKLIMEGLSALIQCLTKSFSTNETTIMLHILRTNQQKSQQIMYDNNLIQQENQQVMLMTLKFMKLTTAGWIQIIPSCLYFFEMQKDATFVYLQGQERQLISLKETKEKIQKIFKSYLSKTIKKLKLKFKVQIPPLFYRS